MLSFDPQVSETTMKIIPPVPITYLQEARCSSHASNKTTYCSKLNAVGDMKIQLPSVKPDLKEVYKTVKQCHSYSSVFVGVCWKIQVF